MVRNLVRGFLSVLGGQVGVLALSILITPIFTRILGSTSYGDYAFLTSTLGLIMIIVNAGIFDGIRKYISEPRELDCWESDVFAFYFRTGILLICFVSVLLIFAIQSGAIGQLVGKRFEPYFYILALLIGTKQLSKIARSGLMGFELEHYSEPLKVIERVVFGVVAISALLLGYGVGAVLISYIISTSLITIMALWLLRPYISYGRIFAKTTDEFPRSELISFNSMTILLTGLMTSLYHIDVLLLQPLVGSQQTGYYKIALVAAEFLWLAPFALQVVLLHSTSELWMDNRYDKITEMASRATRYGILLTSLLAIGIASLADPFLPLYFGPEYDAAISPLLLLLPGALGFALARPILGIGQGKGNLRVLVIATGIAAFMNIVLNLLLIPRYGMNGAAIATSIGYGSMLLLHVWSAGKLGFNPLYDLRLFRVVLTVVLSAPIIAGLAYVISEDLLALVLVPPCGFVIYLFVAIRTKAIRPAEIRRVATRMPILSERLQ